jgi:hypothetical protein
MLVDEVYTQASNLVSFLLRLERSRDHYWTEDFLTVGAGGSLGLFLISKKDTTLSSCLTSTSGPRNVF